MIAYGLCHLLCDNKMEDETNAITVDIHLCTYMYRSNNYFILIINAETLYNYIVYVWLCLNILLYFTNILLKV